MKAWLKKGDKLSNKLIISRLLFIANDWQIYETNAAVNVLICKSSLVVEWSDLGLLSKDLFSPVSEAQETLLLLSSPMKYALIPLDKLPSPESKGDGLALAYAIKSTRDIYPSGSLHGGIFVEQYSRVLPISGTDGESDDEVLGKWLSGGVNIPATSFRRITKLNGFLSPNDLLEIMEVTGLPEPTGLSLIEKSKKKRHQVDQAESDQVRLDEKQKTLNDDSEQFVAHPFILAGRPKLEEFFNEHIIDIILNSEKYKKLGIEFPSAVILHGPPGCGKTFAVEKLVEHIGWPSFYIDSNSVGSPYIHETSKKVSELFDKAIDNAPSVIVIDEMESFLSERNHGGGSGQHHIEEVAEFLRRIPEAINKNVLIIAMTNMIDAVDPAIRRRGRFDHIIEVGMPSSEEVLSLLTSLLKVLPTAHDLNINELVRILAGRALSDSSFVIREAARIAAKSDKSSIDQSCINKAVKLLPKLDEKKKRAIGFVN